MHHGLDDATADSMQYSRLDILVFWKYKQTQICVMVSA